MQDLKKRVLIFVLILSFSLISSDIPAQQPQRGVKVSSQSPPSLSELYNKSHAIVIGINRYEKWPELEYAVNDARAFESRLKEMGFQTASLIDHQATRVNVLKVLGDDLPRKVGRNDRVVIFFAGHGQTEELPDGGQMGYIIPVDGDTRDLFSSAISMEQVRAFSRRLQAKHVLYIIDGCFSGLGLARAGTIPPSEQDYLRKITTRKAHQMLTAGGKGEQAREEGGHGVFTKYLLEALGGAADREDKGYVTFSDIAAYVRPNVSRSSQNAQTPQYGSIEGEGEFVFALKDTKRTMEETAIKDSSKEKERLEEERRRLEEDRARVASLRQQVEEQKIVEEERKKLEAERRQLEEERKRMEEEQKQVSMAQRVGQPFTDIVTGMRFVFVKGGKFEMGNSFEGGYREEKPVHEVIVSDFYMSKYEVTVGEFQNFVEETGYQTVAERGEGIYAEGGIDATKNWRNPGFAQERNDPVVGVSYNDVMEFIKWLNQKAGRRYRLPTEAEWEYAARSGGKREKWVGTSNEGELGKYAWYKENSGGRTHPVGQKLPNGLGLYDMSGNVWEWCQDWHDENYYQDSPSNNPKGPSNGKFKVIRGGSVNISAVFARASYRSRSNPSSGTVGLGFRLVYSPH